MEKPLGDFATDYKKNPHDAIESLVDELGLYSIVRDKFWGSVEIQFQNGIPTLIKKTETKRFMGNNPNDNHNKNR